MPKPLIKWPGGKAGEIEQFLPLIPDYDRYIEPFVGGGALYFYLNPPCAALNDLSESLMEFYALVQEQDPALHRLLDLYSRSFGALKKTCLDQMENLELLYRLYEEAAAKGRDLRPLRIHADLTQRIVCADAVRSELILDEEEYLRICCDSVEDKFCRTARNNQKKRFCAPDLRRNLLTGFTAGYYLYFRSVFNQILKEKIVPSRAYRIANFYFIREYCYGSMFRYNASGEFNIPYGGISYNKKELAPKIERMYAPQTAALLERTQLACMDFEAFLEDLELTERDFLFLDPPYDTEFSDYEGKQFDHSDQERLARFLTRTKAQFLLVIQNTDFIYRLYEGKFRILAFENRYVYNVRSRNERKSEHLLITNIPEGTVPWYRENL